MCLYLNYEEKFKGKKMPKLNRLEFTWLNKLNAHLQLVKINSNCLFLGMTLINVCNVPSSSGLVMQN